MRAIRACYKASMLFALGSGSQEHGHKLRTGEPKQCQTSFGSRIPFL